jgi:hypothetical protein
LSRGGTLYFLTAASSVAALNGQSRSLLYPVVGGADISFVGEEYLFRQQSAVTYVAAFRCVAYSIELKSLYTCCKENLSEEHSASVLMLLLRGALTKEFLRLTSLRMSLQARALHMDEMPRSSIGTPDHDAISAEVAAMIVQHTFLTRWHRQHLAAVIDNDAVQSEPSAWNGVVPHGAAAMDFHISPYKIGANLQMLPGWSANPECTAAAANRSIRVRLEAACLWLATSFASDGALSPARASCDAADVPMGVRNPRNGGFIATTFNVRGKTDSTDFMGRPKTDSSDLMGSNVPDAAAQKAARYMSIWPDKRMVNQPHILRGGSMGPSGSTDTSRLDAIEANLTKVMETVNTIAEQLTRDRAAPASTDTPHSAESPHRRGHLHLFGYARAPPKPARLPPATRPANAASGPSA